MKNLKALARVRRKAEKIKENENFIRQYKVLISSVLDLYREKIVRDSEMYSTIKEVIEKIQRIARNCQYTPNCPPNRKKYKSPNYSEHSLLLEVEKECERTIKMMEDNLLN